jgi:hypothetical protein
MKKKDPEIQLNFDETNEDNPVKNNINENNTLGADINRKKNCYVWIDTIYFDSNRNSNDHRLHQLFYGK